MPRNSKSVAAPNQAHGPDPSRIVRPILGALVVLNLVAAGLVLYPPGGSADSLERELVSLQTQIAQKRTLLQQTKEHAEAVQNGRGEGDQFLDKFFLRRRTVSSTLLAELTEAAKQAQIKERGQANASEFVDGSDSLAMMTITADYEGTYSNLMKFVREIDRSPRLMIIESLNAAPQQGNNTLTVSMKINVFVQDDEQLGTGPGGGEAQ
jgi:hypothetical protein